MGTYIKEDPGVSIQNLISCLLKHILSILAVGVLCAALLGGYYVHKTKASSGNIPAQTEDGWSVAEQNSLNHDNYILDQESYTREINSLQRQIRRQDEYLQHSLMMNIDPYQTAVAEAVVRVTVKKNKANEASDIIAWYEKVLKGGTYLTALAEELDTERCYLEEMISFRDVSETMETMIEMRQARVIAEALVEGLSGADNAGRSFCIKVTGADEDWAAQVLDAILDQLETEARKESETDDSVFPKHTVDVIQKSVSVRVDDVLREKQAKVNQSYVELVDQSTKMNTALSNLKEPSIIEDPNASSRISRKKLLKYLLVGGAGGVFLMILLYGLYFLFSDKLDSYRSLQDRFRLNLLGSFRSMSTAERLQEIDTMDMICANVRLYAEGKEHILLAGCADPTLTEQMEKVLSERFPGLQFKTGGSIVDNLQTRELLAQSDAVVLVEERKKSRYSVISQELRFLETVPVKLLGVVVA